MISAPESSKQLNKKNGGLGFVSLGVVGQGVGLFVWSYKNPIAAVVTAIGILLFTAAEAELSRAFGKEPRERHG
jgi:hypothetical protein